MNTIRTLAIALIVAGSLGLAYGGFSYTKDTTVVKLGSVELTAKEKEIVNIPVWAGLATVFFDGALLLMGNRK